MRNIFPTSSCNAIHIAQLKTLPSNLDSAHCILILKPCCLHQHFGENRRQLGFGAPAMAWVCQTTVQPSAAQELCLSLLPRCAETHPGLSWSQCRALGKSGGFRQECNRLLTEKSVYFCVTWVCFFPYVPCCFILAGLAVALALWVII